MADSGAGQFQEDAQYSDKFSSPSYGKLKLQSYSEKAEKVYMSQRIGGRTLQTSHLTARAFLVFSHSGRSGAAERRGSERKRPGGQFSEERDLDQGFQKRGRYEEIPDEEPSVPPATLRVLVRQMDAGGIIGKVCRVWAVLFETSGDTFLCCREAKISRD